MDLTDIKKLIWSYYTTGQPESAVVPILNELSLNGYSEEVFAYLHSLYATVKVGFYAKTLTDTGNAERLINIYGDTLRYCYERKKWLVWNGDVWEWDNGAQLMSLAKEVARNIYNEAASEDDDKRRENIAKWAHTSESEARRKAMIELAQSEIGVPVDIQNIDANHWLFNCRNGTIDLRTGELHKHEPKDLITIINPIDYNPKAKCPLWNNFLNRVLVKPDLIRYVQKAVGYSLTGEIKEQCLFFLYGLGRNGKSTFVNTIRTLMGDYGCQTQTELFMTKDRSGPGPNESLADLQGKRFVVGSEIEDGRRLAVVLIKEMTGGEAIRTERKYEHSFQFQPTHKIWLCGNHKPVITDTTFSIWRRIKLIPFTVTIPDKECDPELPEKLKREMPGILAWAVQGCLAWQGEGLMEPDDVRGATEAYRVEQDVLGEFMDECCIRKSTAVVTKKAFYEAYMEWCKENNQTPVSQNRFRGKVIERGIGERRGTAGVKMWTGITLINRPEEQRELMTESDRSDSGDLTLGEVSIESLAKETFIQKPVTRVTPVTDEDFEKKEGEPF